MSFNKISVYGQLVRDPEMRYTPSGASVLNLSTVTNEKYGETQHTTWFKITVWGKQAEFLKDKAAKGSTVFVEGTLRVEEYTDREGNKRTSLVVNASDVKLLSSWKSEEVSPKAENKQDDEEIPF